MAVTLDVNGAETNSGATATTSISFAGPNISGGLTNSALVVSLVYGNGSSTVAAPSTLTRGAQTLNLIGSTDNGTFPGNQVAWYGLVNPTSGTGTITGTFASAVIWCGQGSSFKGVNQTGGTTTFANYTGGNPTSGQNTSFARAVTTANGDYTMMAGVFGNPAATVWSTPTGVVQTYLDTGLTSIGNASAAQFASTGASDNYTGNNAATDVITMAGFHLVAAAGGAITIGWSRPSDSERPGPAAKQWDEARPFFRPSQVPVPTAFWTPPFSDREKLPPIKRSPDEPWLNTYFIRSPNPVPNIWLPTTGMEDRPPEPKKRPDDSSIEEPQFFQPSQHPVPTRWLPLTGEEDRPPNPNRVPSPDTFPWFVRSPNPVPRTWLPLTGEEDRPPNPNRIPAPDQPFPWFVKSPNPVPTIWLPKLDPDDRPRAIYPDLTGNIFVGFPSASVPISGIAWYKPDADRDKLPAIKRSPDESYPWFVRSPNPVPTIWLPQWDNWERPKPIPPDASLTAFSFKTPAVVSTISGIAWFNPPETRLPPILGDPYAIQTLPFFIEPPLIPFYAAANADDFNPLKAIQPRDGILSLILRTSSVPTPSILGWQRADIPVAQFFFMLT